MLKQLKTLLKIKIKIVQNLRVKITTDEHGITRSTHFLDVVKSSAFVDKTMLIKDFIKSGVASTLITCPKGFGKTTNMNMVKTFLEIDVDANGCSRKQEDVESSERYKLFKLEKNLAISNEKNFVDKYFGNYPVIYVDFSHVNGYTYEHIFDGIRKAIQHAYKQHEYLYKIYLKNMIGDFSEINGVNFASDDNDISSLEQIVSAKKIKYSNGAQNFKKFYDKNVENLTEYDLYHSLNFLSELLFKHFGKLVFILIDEYDTPLKVALNQPHVSIDKVNSFVESLLAWSIRDNEYLKRALMSGVCENVISVTNPIENFITERKFLDNHKFAKYYGFTNREVNELLHITEFYKEEHAEVKKWYNGYSVQGQDLQIYCPYSILCFIKNGGIFKNFWANKQAFNYEILNSPNIKKKFDILIANETIEFNFKYNLTVGELKKLQKILTSSTDETLNVPDDQVELFFYYLYELGYICYAKTFYSGFFKLANQSVKTELMII